MRKRLHERAPPVRQVQGQSGQRGRLHYLNWCLENVTTLTRELREANTDELRKRGDLVDGSEDLEGEDDNSDRGDRQHDEHEDAALDAKPSPAQAPAAAPELRGAVLELRDAVVVLTRITSDLGLAMTRMSNTLDRLERRHFETKPTGEALD